ncbi:MAG: hypothetical protein J6W81_02550 [Lentisphaeria bacterium]|nr:hypothetical protein [Lentisphaeria bacterium]
MMKCKFTPEEYRLLAGKEFHDVLELDPELKLLEQQKIDKTLESRVLLEVTGTGHHRIGRIRVYPLTLAKWSFLWILENPFVCGGEIYKEDLDMMLYLLSLEELEDVPENLHELPGSASGYCDASGLDPEEILLEIKNMIRVAFHPLEMLPENQNDPDENSFPDAVWLTLIGGIAARESGMTLEYCLHRMSLSAVCSLYVNFRKRECTDSAQIYRRPSADVAKKIAERISFLGEEFLKSKKFN